MSYDYEINNYLKSKKANHFLGCFASDELPQNPPYDSSLIVNYSKSHERGTHWVAMKHLNTNHVKYFDSYGFEPDSDDIFLSVHTLFEKYIKKHSKNNKPYENNELNLQDVEADTCGEYAVKSILDGLPMSKSGIINKKWTKYVKSNDVKKNDKWILQEIKLRSKRNKIS
jgi:hypothetical protein